ncbi:MAG: hypothetical protein A3E23_24080 [Burkholderiales bacterium RIFCSPHIGHO2_12_FULL_65_48]|nr:MAG: hypothetical protein A3E23_24080 [Burkholderiales bacterium RIFCSPHIGHO2_12_FULL_65_48]HAM40171.1 hypothetical protein [Candidatus Omnitrophota bacterium]
MADDGQILYGCDTLTSEGDSACTTEFTADKSAKRSDSSSSLEGGGGLSNISPFSHPRIGYEPWTVSDFPEHGIGELSLFWCGVITESVLLFGLE